MDRVDQQQEKKYEADESIHKHEEKKETNTRKSKVSGCNVAADDLSTNMKELRVQEGANSFSSSDGDEEETSDTVNYNTITSLAALKELLQGERGDNLETDSFFQHYFMKHCNTLPSRDTNSPFPFQERRRLSECREEDEDEERKESDPLSSVITPDTCSAAASQNSLNMPPREASSSDGSTDPLRRASGPSRASSSAGVGSSEWEPADPVTAASSQSSLGREQPLNRTVIGEKHKFLVTRAPAQLEKVLRPQAHNAHTVHFGTKGAEELRPSVRSIFTGQNFHRDKKYFDSSLIEMRSSVENVATNQEAEDIWVKRPDPKLKKAHTKPAAGTLADEDGDMSEGRPRAGTWGTQSRSQEPAKKDKKAKQEKETERRKRNKVEPKLDEAISKSTPQSVGQRRSSSQERLATDDEAHPMYQQTIHGTSGVSRRPALFNSLRTRNKSDPKKYPSFLQQLRSAVQNISQPRASSVTGLPKESEPVHRTSTTRTQSPTLQNKNTRKDGSAHPLSDSDKMYYHTVSAVPRRTSPMAKVIDIFRNRQQDQDSAGRRRARALAQQKQLAASGANLRRKGQEAKSIEEKRRSSLGNVNTARHRASDLSLDPHHAAILFRDARGLPKADPFLEKVALTDLEEDDSQIFVKFFKFHKCYDLIPTSAKLVVFDTHLLVKKAFFALVYNGVRAAPLWDSRKQEYVGMLTITDFIKILQMYYSGPDTTMDQLEEHKLDTWRRVLAGSVKPLVWITPDSSLYDAIRMLISNRIHRLPVIDKETGNVLYILTHKRILRFLFLYIKELPKPSYLQCKVRDLQIGTFNNIETATEETSIFEALKKFVNRRVSALPLVDPEGRLKDIYAKFDVINLAAEKTYNNLDVTLKCANEHRNEWFEGVQKCTLDETLFEVMERIVRAEVHRLVVVDDQEKVIGIISLSDLLNYLVLRPTGECNPDLRNAVTATATSPTLTVPATTPDAPDTAPDAVMNQQDADDEVGEEQL